MTSILSFWQAVGSSSVSALLDGEDNLMSAGVWTTSVLQVLCRVPRVVEIGLWCGMGDGS